MSTTLSPCFLDYCQPAGTGGENRSAAVSAGAPADAPLAPREPLELSGLRRDDASLLVAERSLNRLAESRMRDLTGFLDPGDVIVVNTSGTLPAAIAVDGHLVVHLSTELERSRVAGDRVESTWVVELRHRAGHGTTPWIGHRPTAPIRLPAGADLHILEPYAPGGRSEPSERAPTRLWTARLSVPGKRAQDGSRAELTSGPDSGHDPRSYRSAAPDDLLEYLALHGQPIRYGPDAQPWPLAAYQTIFAVEPGSAEMPSAGRGFTTELVTHLVSHGVTVAPIVLHTGVASQEAGELPYPERYQVPAATATAVNTARVSRRRVIAVGTTATRAIETAAMRNGAVVPSEGWTDLVITPERGVRAVDGLLTGWHDPAASHLMLVEAVAGRDILDRSYKAAIRAGFAGHEFGDFHLILP